jgi:hypothetical protein
VQRKAQVRRETKVFGQSIVAGAGSRLRLPHAHLAAHLCLLGFGARPLSQPPAFCVPTRKQGNRELVLESGRGVPFGVSCIFKHVKRVCLWRSFSRSDVKGMNVLRDPIFGSSFGVETARANHHCVSVYMLLRVISLLDGILERHEERLICI